jgi:hypothetical protein
MVLGQGSQKPGSRIPQAREINGLFSAGGGQQGLLNAVTTAVTLLAAVKLLFFKRNIINAVKKIGGRCFGK